MPSILPNKTKEIWSRDGILARIYYQEYRGLTVKTLVIELPRRTQALNTMDGSGRYPSHAIIMHRLNYGSGSMSRAIGRPTSGSY
jgi:hypothetical protein